MMSNQVVVSICIVNWNTKDLLYDCIRSIKELTKGIAYEIIIVDNDSNDGSVEMIEKSFSDCVLIKSKKNLGFVKANNLAVKHSKGKYIFYLNPDTKLLTNSIKPMVQFLEKNTPYGAVGCRLIFPNGKTQYVCARTFPTPFNQFCFLAMLDRIFPKSKYFSTIEMGYWNHKNSRDIDCLSGACMLVRKKIVDQLNGFDSKIFMYAEDVDMCYRIFQEGWKIYYLADEIILHHGGSSSKKHSNFFSDITQRKSNMYFHHKHYGKYKAKQYLLSVFIGSIIRMFAIITTFPCVIFSEKYRKIAPQHSFFKYFKLSSWAFQTIHKNA